MLLYSCGARKSETEKKEANIKTDFSGFFRNSGNSEDLLKTNFNLQTNYLNKWSDNSIFQCEEFSIEPDDETKPSSLTTPDGKTYTFQNAKLTTKKGQQKNDIQNRNSGNSQEILKTDYSKKEQLLHEAQIREKAEAALREKNKKIEREKWNLWNLLWLLLPIIVILVVWKLWKNYKKLKPAL